MPVVAVSKALRDRLGDEGAEDLARLLSSVEEAARESALLLVEERFARRLAETEARLDNRITEEVAKLELQIARVDARITEEVGKLELQIARVDARITEEVAKLDARITEEVAKLRADMSSFKAEIIKWMFLFWIGQLAAVAGLLALFK